MATKKKSSKKSSATAKSNAKKRQDAVTAKLMAVSNEAAPGPIFTCVVGVFDSEGLNHINSNQDIIVWPDIDDAVILNLGDGITDCLAQKGINVPELAPAFQNLKNENKTTVVGQLVTAIGELAG